MAISTTERETLNAAAEIVKRETDAGERVIMRGFGTFSRKDRAAKTARNPKTGEPIAVPAKNVLAFKAAKSTV